tara:strand:- start:667 stop:1467 length:801 start_codon:yes stop_codon:yes gene_type:complete
MDILSHTLSGFTIGATAMQFSNKGIKHKFLILIASGIAAFFPDLDVITHWSGFDSTLGEWFNLNDSGVHIYHQKLWYSHHGLFHSLLMAVVFCLGCALLMLLFKARKSLMFELKNNTPLYLSVFFAYLVHLFEDMPTPEFVWGGVAFMFPSKNYWGGTGHIWWWNNYDLFLIILFAFLSVLILSVLGALIRKSLKWFALVVVLVATTVFFRQMAYRTHDFNYTGFSGHHAVWQANEKKSKQIQKQILGDNLYQIMEQFDNSMPFWF